MGKPFVYLLPMRCWFHLNRENLPYFTIGLGLFSVGYLRPDD